MAIPIYVPVTFSDGPNSGLVMVASVESLPVVPTNSRLLILDVQFGVLEPGLYAYVEAEQAWRIQLPIEAVSLIIVNSDDATVYMNVMNSVAVPPGSAIYRNGVLTGLTVVPANDGSVYAVRSPKQGGGGQGTVDSVNGVAPDVFGNVNLMASNIPGLATVATTGSYDDLIDKPAAYTLPTSSATTLGGVRVPGSSRIVINSSGDIDFSTAAAAKLDAALTSVVSGTGVSLVQGVTAGTATLKGLVAGTNVTITDDGAGSLTIDSTGGGGGAATITLSGDVTGVSDAQGNLPTELAPSGVTAGVYNLVVVDAKGRVIDAENATTLTDLGIVEQYLPLTGGSVSGNVTMTSGSTIKSVPIPVQGTDAANKDYVDELIADAANGVSWRESVVAATTDNLTTLNGLQTVDGVDLVASNRVLVKNQTNAVNNGIWVVDSGPWTRATDTDTGASIFHAAVLVISGTVNALTQWANTNQVQPVVGTDNLTFGQLKGAGNMYTAGAGLSLSGLTFSIAPTGVTAGTYTKMTVNVQGQVVGGVQLSNSDIITALGFAPYNGATNPNAYISGSQPLTQIGDVTASGTLGSPLNTVLSATGVIPSTYSRVTVDSKGRVTAGAQLSPAEIAAALGFTPVNKAGDTMTGALNYAPFATVSSAATTDVGASISNNMNISGTATITSLGVIAAGAVRRLVFQGVLTLTYNSTSLILPTAANITTAVGDTAEFISLGGGNWRCSSYQRADGTSLVSGGGSPYSTTQVFNGSTTQLAAKFKNVSETAVIGAGLLTGNVAIDASLGAVQVFTGNATGNFVFNFRHSAATALGSVMNVGDSVTLAMVTTQGGTPFVCTGFQIDGVNVTAQWQGGAPTFGNANGRDVYAVTIIKTGGATYIVMAAQTQYK